MAKTTTLKEFESVFPKLVEDVLEHSKTYKLPDEFVSWFKNVSLFGRHGWCVLTRELPVSECQYHWW